MDSLSSDSEYEETTATGRLPLPVKGFEENIGYIPLPFFSVIAIKFSQNSRLFERLTLDLEYLYLKWIFNKFWLYFNVEIAISFLLEGEDGIKRKASWRKLSTNVCRKGIIF